MRFHGFFSPHQIVEPFAIEIIGRFSVHFFFASRILAFDKYRQISGISRKFDLVILSSTRAASSSQQTIFEQTLEDLVKLG